MEEKIKIFEDFLEKKIDNWTNEDLLKIVSDEKMRNLYTPDVIEDIYNSSENNEELRKLFYPSKLIMNLEKLVMESESKLVKDENENEYLTEEAIRELSKEEYLCDPITYLELSLLELNYVSPERLELAKREVLINKITEVIEILKNHTNPNDHLEIVLEIIDMIADLRQSYFDSQGEDLRLALSSETQEELKKVEDDSITLVNYIQELYQQNQDMEKGITK